MQRKAYPSDVSDEEWALLVPYLTLMNEDAPQHDYPLREVFNTLRRLICAGASWRMMPRDLPPWHVVCQQTDRWLKAHVFESFAHDLHTVLRIAQGRRGEPSATIFDSRTLQSSPERGSRAGYDGAKRRKSSKTHLAVDTLDHLLALCVTTANEQNRARVDQLCEAVQEVTGKSVEVAFVDQGYTREQAAEDAAMHGILLEVVKLPEAKRGFVLLPRGWVVERGFAWAARFRRLARDYERPLETLAVLHYLVFVTLMVKRIVEILAQSS